jgi:Mrp family chromosome partitioning ATPase
MSRTEQCPAFIRRKEGRGKTTWCPSIAGYLAKSGNKVLIEDVHQRDRRGWRLFSELDINRLKAETNRINNNNG